MNIVSDDTGIMKAERFLLTTSFLTFLVTPLACVDKITFPGGMAGSSSGGDENEGSGGKKSTGGSDGESTGGTSSGGAASGGRNTGGSGNDDCPADLPAEGSSCDESGLQCDYNLKEYCGFRTAICEDGEWKVAIPSCPEPVCPDEVPEEGTTCDYSYHSCQYGSCSEGSFFSFDCGGDGLWKEKLTGCPPSFQKVKDKVALEGTDNLKVWGEKGDLWVLRRGLGAPGLPACGQYIEPGTQIYRDTGEGLLPAPLPVEKQAFAIHSSSPDNVWIAGQYGSVTSFDGEDWVSHDEAIAAISGEEDPCTNFFFGVHTLGPDDTWIAGSHGLFHFDGETWTKPFVGGNKLVTDVHAISATEVWATFPDRGIARYDGTDWDLGPFAGQGGLYARSATDVWVTGVMGVDDPSPADVQHFTGAGWQKAVSTSQDTELFYVTGNARGDTYGLEIRKDRNLVPQVLVKIDSATRLSALDRTFNENELLVDVLVTPEGHLYGLTKSSLLEFDTSGE